MNGKKSVAQGKSNVVKRRNGRRLFSSLQWRVLFAYLILSAVPLCFLGWYITNQFGEVQKAVTASSTTYERRAARISAKITDFLYACEDDLRDLALIEQTDEAYLEFAHKRKRAVWVRGGTNNNILEERGLIPIYKEISFIGPKGLEQISIVNDKLVSKTALRDVSDPQNTTYRSERYFLEAARNQAGEIYVSHLNGFHLGKFKQLGLEKIINNLDEVDDRTKRIYRFVMYEMFRSAELVEYVGDFDEDERRILVYRVPYEEARIMVEDPGDIGDEELAVAKLEFESLVGELAPEDVVEGDRYNGVIRFAMPVFDDGGKKKGIISLALDHAHLMQFTQHVQSMKDNAVVFAGYRDANYTYLFDDEGWIITHPKQWNIRGVSHKGTHVKAYTLETSALEKILGKCPVNLMQLDWKMGEGYHNVVLQPRLGRSGIASARNLGGVLRTRIYSPIFYDTGPYAKHGIFGGVMFGTDAHFYAELMRQMNAKIASLVEKSQKSLRIPLASVAVALILLSIFFTRRFVGPVKQLRETALRIGKGELDVPVPKTRDDEIGDLSDSIQEMAHNLKITFEALEGRNAELKTAQQKLLEVERKKQQHLEQEVSALQKKITRASFAGIVAESAQMKKTLAEVMRVSASSATVLIRGENGTGKELVAEAIHKNSRRSESKFLKINCAAFNDNLLESEMFGHVRGSYTGATVDRRGLFEVADGGTLLLDEVGDMSLNMQKKLLRTLQEGEVVPLGSSKVIKVDVRLLAATNKDLDLLMKEGQFREDLYHRLNVINVSIAPLRERTDDILPLAGVFLQKFIGIENKPITGISEEAINNLLEYPWPGNVRELENALERAVIRAMGSELYLEDFQLSAKNHRLARDQKVGTLDLSLSEMERTYILSVLDKNKGNKKATAESLGIGYNTLWRKIKKYAAE